MKNKKKNITRPDKKQTDNTKPKKNVYVILAVLAIMVFSLILGIVCIDQYKETPFWDWPITDERSYYEWGKTISEGHVLGDKIYYQDPLYPYFLGFVFAIFGDNLFAVRLIQLLITTLTIPAIFWMGKRLFGDAAGILAALFFALYGILYFYEILILKVALIVFFSSFCCAFGIWAAQKPDKKAPFILIGISLALLMLLRGNFQALIPFSLIFAFVIKFEDPFKKKATRTILLFMGLFIILCPIMIRNYVVGGELVLTTSQAGANFYIGNNHEAKGFLGSISFVRPNPKYEAHDFTKEAEKRANRRLSPSEVSRFWFKESFKWMRENPDDAFWLWMHKARLMIHDFEVPDNHSFYITRKHFVTALWVPFIGFGLLWGPSLIGMFIMVRANKASWFPALFAVLYTGTVIPFFILSRYRLAIIPAMTVFSAVFVIWLITKIREKNLRQIIPAAVVLVILYLLSFVPTIESSSETPVIFRNIGAGYLRGGNPQEALKWYDMCLKYMPSEIKAIQGKSTAIAHINRDSYNKLINESNKPGLSSQELIRIGKEAEVLEQFKFAAVLYERSISLNDNQMWAHAHLSVLYMERHEIKDMLKSHFHIKKAYELEPNNVDVIYVYGNCMYKMGNKIGAKKMWKEVLRQNPDYPGAQQNLNLLEKEKAKNEK